jgi:hypothetical protein
MDTLLGFITFTKGIEYLIAIGFLMAFIAYWQFVYGKGRRRWIPIAILSYMVVGIMILVGSCLTMAPR